MTPQQPSRKTIFGIKNLEFTASLVCVQEAWSMCSPLEICRLLLQAGNLEAPIPWEKFSSDLYILLILLQYLLLIHTALIIFDQRNSDTSVRFILTYFNVSGKTILF